ncbi:integrase [Escherichia coli]|nr:integrase [Escherichia coli]
MCIQGALAWQEIKAGTIIIRRNPRLTNEFTLPGSKAKTKHVIAFTDRGWQKTFRIRYPF